MEWIDTLYVLIAACRVMSLLFAPLFLQYIAYSESIQKTDYIIRLKDYLTKTLLVKRVGLDFIKFFESVVDLVALLVADLVTLSVAESLGSTIFNLF